MHSTWPALFFRERLLLGEDSNASTHNRCPSLAASCIAVSPAATVALEPFRSLIICCWHHTQYRQQASHILVLICSQMLCIPYISCTFGSILQSDNRNLRMCVWPQKAAYSHMQLESQPHAISVQQCSYYLVQCTPP